jgi:methionyl-tRNA synthetase
LRVVSVLLHSYMPETTTRLLDALGQAELSLDDATFGARPGGATVGELPPLFPKVEAAEPA